MSKFSLDDQDIKMLHLLQQDGRQSVSDLAEKLHISVSACHRRLQRLHENKVISGYHALVDIVKVGMSMTFYVDVTLQQQSTEVFEEFEQAIRDTDEILQCHLLAGQADYLLFIAAKDAKDFARIHQNRLSQLPHVAKLHSNLVIREVKPFKGYRLNS